MPLAPLHLRNAPVPCIENHFGCAHEQRGAEAHGHFLRSAARTYPDGVAAASAPPYGGRYGTHAEEDIDESTELRARLAPCLVLRGHRVRCYITR